MSSRAREPRKKVTGITRMDAALDAMRQIGFGTKLIRKTVQELLDVYGGSQGWPFIEETSYKLLIETLLSKQEGFYLQDGVDDVIPSSGISEVGSCELMSEDTVMHNSTQDGLNSSSQASDQGNAPANLETAVGGIPKQGMNNSKHKQKAADNVKGSKDSTVIKGVKIASDKAIMIPSSKVFNPPPNHMREAYYGWIGNGSDEDKEYVHFPIPHLSEQIEKMIGQYVTPRKRRKSRWDEKPECM